MDFTGCYHLNRRNRKVGKWKYFGYVQLEKVILFNSTTSLEMLQKFKKKKKLFNLFEIT